MSRTFAGSRFTVEFNQNVIVLSMVKGLKAIEATVGFDICCSRAKSHVVAEADLDILSSFFYITLACDQYHPPGCDI